MNQGAIRTMLFHYNDRLNTIYIFFTLQRYELNPNQPNLIPKLLFSIDRCGCSCRREIPDSRAP